MGALQQGALAHRLCVCVGGGWRRIGEEHQWLNFPRVGNKSGRTGVPAWWPSPPQTPGCIVLGPTMAQERQWVSPSNSVLLLQDPSLKGLLAVPEIYQFAPASGPLHLRSPPPPATVFPRIVLCLGSGLVALPSATPDSESGHSEGSSLTLTAHPLLWPGGLWWLLRGPRLTQAPLLVVMGAVGRDRGKSHSGSARPPRTGTCHCHRPKQVTRAQKAFGEQPRVTRSSDSLCLWPRRAVARAPPYRPQLVVSYLPSPPKI